MPIYKKYKLRRKKIKMNKKIKTKLTLPSDQEILITRTFDGPRDLVWQMWTTAEHLRQWWGPEGWTLPVCELDFRPGGTWFYCMEGPDGMQSCGKATYLDIDVPQRIIYEDAFADSEGNLIDDMPVAHITLEFVEEGSKTTVVNIVRYPTKADRDKVIEMGMEAGIDQTWNRLDAYLAKIGS
jgi:uncharacterized protein YndB with AHSA1/START domain